jgi:phosphoserine phosphatase
LVRHGESSYNVEQRVQGHCDESTLTEKGRVMAAQVGSALTGLSFDAAYASPLQRAAQTAQIITAGLQPPPSHPIHFTDNLKEISLPLWEGILFHDVAQQFPDLYQHWLHSPHDLCMQVPDGSGQTQAFYPVRSLFSQAQTFWQELLGQHDGQTVLVVAHSGINRALICTALGLPPSSYQAINQSNCGISVLNFTAGFGSPVQIESLNQTAHLGQPIPTPRKEFKGVRLMLVRHGETDWNRQGRFQGQIDVPLNDHGRRQAGQAQTFLQAVPVDYAVTSPMLRPKETAEIILQAHPQVKLEDADLLKEISHGLWEGKLESEIEQGFPGELERWKASPETVQMPEGENLQDIWGRAVAAWDGIVATAKQRPPGTTLVVAHDAINKAILCHVLGLGPENFWNFKQGNGAVSVIDYPVDGSRPPVMQAMNITSHLDGGVLDKTAAGAL